MLSMFIRDSAIIAKMSSVESYSTNALLHDRSAVCNTLNSRTDHFSESGEICKEASTGFTEASRGQALPFHIYDASNPVHSESDADADVVEHKSNMMAMSNIVNGNDFNRQSAAFVDESREMTDNQAEVMLPDTAVKLSANTVPFEETKRDLINAALTLVSMKWDRTQALSKDKTKCPICSMTFKRNASVKKHIAAVHLKFKPFMCPQCFKTFAYKGSRDSHIRTVHEGLRPFVCPISCCNKRFSTKDNMNRHCRNLHRV